MEWDKGSNSRLQVLSHVHFSSFCRSQHVFFYFLSMLRKKGMHGEKGKQDDRSMERHKRGGGEVRITMRINNDEQKLKRMKGTQEVEGQGKINEQQKGDQTNR